MSRSLRYLQIFQGKNSRKIPPIDFNRSEISDIVTLVRNSWCSCRVYKETEIRGFFILQKRQSATFVQHNEATSSFSDVLLRFVDSCLLSQTKVPFTPGVSDASKMTLWDRSEINSIVLVLYSKHLPEVSTSMFWKGVAKYFGATPL